MGILILVETKISGKRRAQIRRKLPYSHCETTDPIGNRGGVLMLWNAREADVAIILKVFSRNHSWILSSIYASPCFDTPIAFLITCVLLAINSCLSLGSY